MRARQMILTLCLLLACSIPMLAQPGPKGQFNREEFNAKLEEHIAQHAKLTPEEAEKFFPLFHEMKEKQHELQGQMVKLKREKPSYDATDKDYQNIIMSIKSLSVQMAQVEETYYKRMCKAIPARKVYDAMNAEDKFFRKMFSRFNHENRKK